MSWQACEWMDSLPYDICERLEQRVLLKLCNVADVDGTRAYRSKGKLAQELGCDPKSVQRAFRKLEALDLIRLGDQRLVAHLRAGWRPTVYDLNFGFHRMYSQPEIDLDPTTDIEPAGQGGHGYPQVEGEGTSGGTSEVPLGTKELSYQDSNEEPYVSERAQAHEIDAASGAPHRPLARWSRDDCPGDWQTHTHELGSRGYCIHCFERPTIGA